MPSEQININIDEMVGISLLGVRRAAVFMGLGLNAAAKDDFNDYELRKLPKALGQTGFPIDFLPPNLSSEQINEFKKHFALWIIACGFRELLEHYAMFLDHVHEACLLVAISNKRFTQEYTQKQHKQFVRNFGIPSKQNKLEELFSIKPDNAECIKQLYAVRNALTHDLGIVTQERCGDENTMNVTWRAFDTIAKGQVSGIETNLIDLIGCKTEEPIEILAKFPLRQKAFPVGSVISFTQQDLWEICFFFSSIAIPSTRNSLIRHLSDHGVPIRHG